MFYFYSFYGIIYNNISIKDNAMNTKMESEILSQKDLLINSIKNNDEKLKALAKIIKTQKPSKIIIVARGSSDNACTFFKYYAEIKLGIPVLPFYPSVITAYNSNFNFADSIVIGVSQSGQALDCITVMKEARKQKATVIAITNYDDSNMAKECDIHLNLSVGVENSVAATKTFTSEMLILKGVVDYCLEGKTNEVEVEESITDAINNADNIKICAKRLFTSDQIIVLSRGLSLSVANEIALKLQETSYINARSYAISDFHHGPFALTNENMKFIIIAVDDKTNKDALEIINKIKETKADITLITNDVSMTKHCDYSIMLKNYGGDSLPFGASVVGQFLALNISLLKNLNPDCPRGLNKVTVTI